MEDKNKVNILEFSHALKKKQTLNVNHETVILLSNIMFV